MARSFFPCVFLVLASALAFAADRPALPPNLSLNQALEIALANSILLREAQAGLEQASARYAQSRSPRLPQIGINARQNLQTVNLVGIGVPVPGVTGKLGPFGSMDARISLNQEIINFAHRHTWESVKAQEDSSRLLVENARELIALNVVAAYLDALRAKTTRDTLVEQIRLATELYRLTRERVDQGAAAELDAIRATQQVNTLEQQRQEAEQTYISTKLDLANIIQARVTSDFEVADSAAYGEGTLPERDSSVQAAMMMRADYRAAEANVKAAELKVKSIKATRLPTVRASVDDGQQGNSPVHNLNTYRIQGVVEIPIYTGGRTKGEIEEAEAAMRDAVTVLDNSRSQIETDVLSAISGVEWALREVATSAGNVNLSRQEVDLSRMRFTQGVTDNTEVVNAQDRLARADSATIRAQYNLGIARANLARAVGTAETTYHK
jgi:outer membrane protein TolC